MTLKIIFYLFVSILAVGVYHWTYQWFQDSFSQYFSLSKVKKTDKLFDLVVATGDSISPEKESTVLEKENANTEGKKGEEGAIEDLFQFIDGL